MAVAVAVAGRAVAAVVVEVAALAAVAGRAVAVAAAARPAPVHARVAVVVVVAEAAAADPVAARLHRAAARPNVDGLRHGRARGASGEKFDVGLRLRNHPATDSPDERSPEP